jgi:TPR repeat protein
MAQSLDEDDSPLASARKAAADSWRKCLLWYSMAAAQKEPQACFNLAINHLEGNGTPVDRRRAVELFRIAAECGYMTRESAAIIKRRSWRPF